MRLWLTLSCVLLGLSEAHAQPMGTIFPSSRAVQVGQPATTYAVLVNPDSTLATGCLIRADSRIPSLIPVTYLYQGIDATTYQLIGEPNTPVDIPPGGTQMFLLTFVPLSPFPDVDIVLSFACSTGSSGGPLGLSSLHLSASTDPLPDIIAVPLAPELTLSPNRTTLLIATDSIGAFVGAGTIAVSTGAVDLPISVCAVSPGGETCRKVPTSGRNFGGAQATPFSITPLPPGAGTVSIVLKATGAIPFDPEHHRVLSPSAVRCSAA